MANDYATLAQLKAALPDAIPPAEGGYDLLLTNLLTRASRMIDTETKRHPGAYAMPSASSDEETRYFSGSAGSQIWIGELATSPSAVAVSQSGGVASSDYTSIPSSDYFLWPENAALVGEPYTRIDLDTINGAYTTFYTYRRGVKITGVFGYSDTSDTPPEIVQATIIQASRWFGRARQGYHDAGANPALGQLMYVNQLDPDVKEIIWQYRRVTI